MKIKMMLENKNGITLIELLIALVISAFLIAGIYRTFIWQQKTYIVQEQVVDMQQNLRAAINRMIREIRMAGFGLYPDSDYEYDNVLKSPGGVNGFTKVITVEGNEDNNVITIIGGFKQIYRDNGEPIVVNSASGKKLTLNYATDEFDREKHRYISIGGLESNIVLSRSENVITLEKELCHNHPPGTPIFKIQAITYRRTTDNVLRRDENTGGGGQPLAENIENILFEYFDERGVRIVSPEANPGDIRMVKVTITARTERSDPDYKSEEGIRRRTIASNIKVRNMGLINN